ncbi:threonine synthase [Bradyrhizobium sp. LM2.7]
MHYVSTRGDSGRKQFCETLLEGLAQDGGLYVPETYPHVDDIMLDAWRALSYPSLAFEVLSLYVSDIPPADLKAICEKTYTPEIFGSPAIAPLRKLETGLYLQEL